MGIHLPLACKPKTTIDFYKVLLVSVVSDQYMVSGLSNCLVDVKHYNKTLKCFKTFNNVIARLVYKGIYGLQCKPVSYSSMFWNEWVFCKLKDQYPGKS